MERPADQMPVQKPGRRDTQRRWLFSLGVSCDRCLHIVLSACLLIAVAGCGQSGSSADALPTARAALLKGDFQEAFDQAQRVPPTSADFSAAMLTAGEAASRLEKLDDAADCYEALLAQQPKSDDANLAEFSLGEIRLQQGRLQDAEKHYRSTYKAQPDNLLVNERLAFLLSLTGRRWESLDHYFVLIKSGEATYRELALAADVDRGIEQPDFLKQCQAANPDGILVRMAIAYRSFLDGEPETNSRLEQLISDQPDLLAAHLLLGERIVNAASGVEFQRWNRALPTSAEQAADTWYIRGLFARKCGDLKTAAACFTEAVRRVPVHRRACYLLGQTLAALNSPTAEDVNACAERMVRLTQLVDRVLETQGQFPEPIQEAAELLEQLGRIWEACAWGVLGRQLDPAAAWHRQLFAKHQARLNDQLPKVIDQASVVQGLPFQVPDFHQWLDQQSLDGANPETMVSASSAIRFRQTGAINFRYDNSEDLQTKGMRMFEQTGGGVGILDIDADGWPDTYLPQGAPWPTGQSSPVVDVQRQDGLFRNRTGLSGRSGSADVVFQDVSSAVVAPTTGYGQGCAVGDFNNDGFDDLYVANVGRNQLLLNMGDGTFEDATPPAVDSVDQWSVSVMMCDMNADSQPDLFDVNYVEGEDVYQKICNGRSCSPSVFEGAANRIWMNTGDGNSLLFSYDPAETLSKGLGVIAFEQDVPRRPTIFVANDQVANFFLANDPADNRWNLSLTNRAMLSGLAFNNDGVAMACMGIAVDDFDANGRLDVYVTNFQNEANTLYLQDAPGLFVDATNDMNLTTPSLPMTGWGVQSIDADLDGRPDLVVVNGHVDDFTDVDGPYRMSPQFYHHAGDHFTTVDSQQLGPWFQNQYLGRGLARVDFDRDGRVDFIASLINDDVGTIRNQTETANHFLTVRLVATQTARMATGTTVTVTTSDATYTRQLLAGDGYMASNERALVFGLGTSPEILGVTVNWPSGSRTEWRQPEIDCCCQFVEQAVTATVHRDAAITSVPVVYRESVSPPARSSDGSRP